MKTKSIIIFLIALIMILFGSYFLFFNNPNSEEDVSYSALLQNVFPEMKTYCNQLESNAELSSCPTCRNDLTECNFVNSSEFDKLKDVCKIEKEGDQYLLSINRHLIYGSNNRPGSVILSFNLDKEGNIISKNLPEKPCM